MVRLAVVGAGGLVGKRVVENLGKDPIADLELYVTGHERSVGKLVEYSGGFLRIKRTDPGMLMKMDIVLLCTPSEASVELVSSLKNGPLIIDTSSAFRMEDSVPLVVPEVNGHELAGHKGLIAGPNCSTIQLVMSLCPIHREFGLARVHVSTYQSVSGAGYKAIEELEHSSFEKIATGNDGFSRAQSQFPHPIAFNLIPQIDSFTAWGYTKEEMKMINETRKILGLEYLAISCTCVRVPVFIGHSEACMVETLIEPSVDKVRRCFTEFPGITVMDDPAAQIYPTPLYSEDTDDVYVGRLRKDLSSPHGILYWLVADNLRRGAATNACNIVRTLLGGGY
ncbi:MAG: aspartate-semialdehyde dehydrogenase [Bacillota bacterium]|jgi:aspartate-semialdehyde dehydrogenase